MLRRTRWLPTTICTLSLACAGLAAAGPAGADPTVPPCSDQASCEALFLEAFGCNSVDSCQAGFPQCDPATTCEAYFQHAIDVFSGGASGGGGGTPPPPDGTPPPPSGGPAPPCTDQASCQAWFASQAPAPPPSGGGSGNGNGSGNGAQQPPPSSSSTSSPSTSGSSTPTEPAPEPEDEPRAPRGVALIASCDGRSATVRLAGRDRSRVKSVAFYAGKRELRRDFRAPFAATAPRGAKVRAVVRFRNGASRTITARAKRC